MILTDADNSPQLELFSGAALEKGRKLPLVDIKPKLAVIEAVSEPPEERLGSHVPFISVRSPYTQQLFARNPSERKTIEIRKNKPHPFYFGNGGVDLYVHDSKTCGPKDRELCKRLGVTPSQSGTIWGVVNWYGVELVADERRWRYLAPFSKEDPDKFIESYALFLRQPRTFATLRLMKGWLQVYMKPREVIEYLEIAEQLADPTSLPVPGADYIWPFALPDSGRRI